MKKIAGLLLLSSSFLLLAPFFSFGQQPSGQQPSPDKNTPQKQSHSIGIGVTAGFNFSNVTNAAGIGASSRTGYNFGIFLSPASHSILGSRTELIYSRHGYSYAHDSSAGSGTAPGSVDLDYIMLAQYMAINITKYVQIHLGGQTSYLLHAKVDSGSQQTGGNAAAASALSYYNRFDYGFGGGIEVHPYAGLVVGGRYSISLSNLFNTSYPSSTNTGTPPSFAPGVGSINLKNNLVQLYIGYRF